MEPRPSFAWIGGQGDPRHGIARHAGPGQDRLRRAGLHGREQLQRGHDGARWHAAMAMEGQAAASGAMWLLAAMPMAGTLAIDRSDELVLRGAISGGGRVVQRGRRECLRRQQYLFRRTDRREWHGEGRDREQRFRLRPVEGVGRRSGGSCQFWCDGWRPGRGRQCLARTGHPNAGAEFSKYLLWRHVGQGRSDQERIGSANACWRQQLCRCHRCQPWCSYPRSARGA